MLMCRWVRCGWFVAGLRVTQGPSGAVGETLSAVQLLAAQGGQAAPWAWGLPKQTCLEG